jgi:hypothetical protein
MEKKLYKDFYEKLYENHANELKHQVNKKDDIINKLHDL